MQEKGFFFYEVFFFSLELFYHRYTTLAQCQTMGTTSSCASCDAELDEESRRLRAARDRHIAQQNAVNDLKS